MTDRLAEIEQHAHAYIPVISGRQYTEPELWEWIRQARIDRLWLISEVKRLRAALVEIPELDLEGGASLADAIKTADEVINA